jgi:uncharacterized ubiquitin-like protein YukD
MSSANILDLLKGLLTPAIAIGTTYIAWQQWKTNQRKLILDRYDRRLKVFEETRSLIAQVIQRATVSYDELGKFYFNVSEAEFLFGDDISIYIDEIYQRGIHLAYCTEQYRDFNQEVLPGYDHEAIVKGKHEELSWFVEQTRVLKAKFRKYLDISA